MTDALSSGHGETGRPSPGEPLTFRGHLSRDTRTAREPDWRVMGELALLITVVALGLALSASAALAAPTKAQFIRQGDALCRQVQRELVPLASRAQAAKSLPVCQQWAAAERLWGDQIRIQARFTARLRAVGVPTGDSKARSIVRGLDRGLVLARRVRDAFARRSTTSLAAALPEYIRFTMSLNRRVAAYGFRSADAPELAADDERVSCAVAQSLTVRRCQREDDADQIEEETVDQTQEVPNEGRSNVRCSPSSPTTWIPTIRLPSVAPVPLRKGRSSRPRGQGAATPLCRRGRFRRSRTRCRSRSSRRRTAGRR